MKGQEEKERGRKWVKHSNRGKAYLGIYLRTRGREGGDLE